MKPLVLYFDDVTSLTIVETGIYCSTHWSHWTQSQALNEEERKSVEIISCNFWYWKKKLKEDKKNASTKEILRFLVWNHFQFYAKERVLMKTF